MIGSMYGGIQSSRNAFVDFMERNQATIFDNHLDAKRKLQNHVTIHFAKGAFKWAWRMTAFTGGFTLVFFSLHAYRGSTSLLDYGTSGAIIGAILRLKLGPTGILIGGTVGGILGFFCGLVNQSLLSLFNVSYDDVLSAQWKFDRERAMLMEENLKLKFENSNQAPKAAIEMLKDRENQSKEL
ncbi:RPII140-upstream gene protein isoform X2 [Macrosteles quadrilineatus]|nr:RPII140-upstream gene protein isoform X2 [Macrosteles quadrilineatus]